jgi:hypothetical protein
MTKTPSTFNILSGQEVVTADITGRSMLVNQVKNELFKNLEAQDRLINRNDLANTIFLNRFDN